MEGKDVYILLAFALLRRRRPASPHRQSPCRFTGDHPVHHVDDALLGLTPEHGHFSNTNEFTKDRKFDWLMVGYPAVKERDFQRSERWSILPAYTKGNHSGAP
jgi:hypothetical protein